MFFHMVYKSG